VVRYADDMVLGFQYRADAERFLQEWRGRLQKFGLELHPDKTRLIEFGRFAATNLKERGKGKPETFNFLGFTHICGQTRKNGKFLVLRRERGSKARTVPRKGNKGKGIRSFHYAVQRLLCCARASTYGRELLAQTAEPPYADPHVRWWGW